MKHSIYLVLAVFVAWASFVSASRADAPASIEIVGVKLIDKDNISVQFEVTNASDKNISLDCKEHANIWVRTAGLNGKYFWDDPLEYNMAEDRNHRPQIIIYFAETVTHSWKLHLL